VPADLRHTNLISRNKYLYVCISLGAYRDSHTWRDATVGCMATAYETFMSAKKVNGAMIICRVSGCYIQKLGRIHCR